VVRVTTYATSRDGAVVRVGDWVHYSGSLVQYLGQIVRVEAVDSNGRLALSTAVGGRLGNVRGQSVRPCGDESTPCGCGAA
jgi:hypothetical protein